MTLTSKQSGKKGCKYLQMVIMQLADMEVCMLNWGLVQRCHAHSKHDIEYAMPSMHRQVPYFAHVLPVYTPDCGCMSV